MTMTSSQTTVPYETSAGKQTTCSGFAQQLKQETCPLFVNTMFKMERAAFEKTGAQTSVTVHWNAARQQICDGCSASFCQNSGR